MTNVRGVIALNTVRFVKEVYGPEAHERVLARVSQGRRASFLGTIREGSWGPLEDVLAYMEAAKALLAPEEPDFFRNLGRFSGQAERRAQGFRPLVADASTTMRMAPTAWRAFYDRGRIEVVSLGPREAVARIHDFPAHRANCQRMCGAWEGLLETEELAVRVTETVCALDGSPCCEMRVAWYEKGSAG